MNFEKEARETIEEISDLDWLYEIGKIEGIFAQALRRAFIAGQEDMRERTGDWHRVNAERAEKTAQDHMVGFNSAASMQWEKVAKEHRLHERAIRSLPTLSGEK
jgi:hypothetical protein